MPIVSKISHVFQHFPISHGSKRHMFAITVVNKAISESIAILIAIHDQEINIKTLITGSKLNNYQNQDQFTYQPMMQQPICQPPVYQTPVYQPQAIYQLQPPTIYQPQLQLIHQTPQIQTPPQNLPQNRTQRLRITQQNWRSAIIVYQLIPSLSTQQSGSYQ
ncbi:hypothetical protein G9A89_003390 [Geosiphon pyriformis]|nr:hypothetical protein G9A89_003390 [Geosiphon pyriformis]